MTATTKETTKQIWACQICDGIDVEEKAWVHLNKGTITPDDGHLFYCNDCETEVSKVYVKYEQQESNNLILKK